MPPRKPVYKIYFSQGQGRRFREMPDDFNPFKNLAESAEQFAAEWQDKKISIFVFGGEFTLDVDALKSSTAYGGLSGIISKIQRKKGFSEKQHERHQTSINALLADLQTFKALQKDEKFLQDIAYKAYLKVIPKGLDRYLTSVGARHIASVGGSKETGEDVKIAFKKTFWQVSARGEYSKLWEKVVAIILDGINGNPKYLKKVGTTVTGFGISDLQSVVVERSTSKYRSIYMMEEFGTGQNVEGDQRVYKSKGSTHFKVPPYLIQAAQPAIEEPALKSATAAWYVTSGALAYGEGQYKLYKMMQGKKGKKGIADRAIKNLARNLEGWTYGYKTGDFHKGREARHLFFEKGGVVQAIRDITLDAQIEVVRLFNEELRKRAPNLPGAVALIRRT